MSCQEFEALEGLPSTHGYRYAKSHFAKRKTYGEQVTLAQVRLYTGRTHQIRVHAQSLKLPIIGDSLYNSSRDWSQNLPKTVIQKLQAVKRQMLHARLLGFVHPKTQEKLGFEVPIPDDMKQVIFLPRVAFEVTDN